MRKLAIFSTLFVMLLALTACENRNVSHSNQPPSKERGAPQNPNQLPPADREIQR